MYLVSSSPVYSLESGYDVRRLCMKTDNYLKCKSQFKNNIDRRKPNPNRNKIKPIPIKVIQYTK